MEMVVGLITGGAIAIAVFVLVMFFMKLASSPAYPEDENRERSPQRESSEIELDVVRR